MRLNFAIKLFMVFSMLECLISDSVTITGVVKSKNDSTSIAGADIYIEKYSIGTVSNQDGKFILKSVPKEWANYEAVICEPIILGTKLSKLLKRGWRNVLNEPKLLFDHRNISMKLQFDIHHGYSVLDKAIDVMDVKDREDFRNFVNNPMANPLYKSGVCVPPPLN